MFCYFFHLKTCCNVLCFSFSDGVILKPTHVIPAKPPSTTARINSLLQNNAHHHDNRPVVKTATVARPPTMNNASIATNNPRKHKKPSRQHNVPSQKGPSRNKLPSVHGNQQTVHPHGNHHGGHVNLNRSWCDGENSGPEWSDEDREYVYYVNASHVWCHGHQFYLLLWKPLLVLNCSSLWCSNLSKLMVLFI